MADNVPITAGTGTDIATDDVSSKHYQRVKLTDGTADSTTVIAAGGGTEATALRVTVATDSTGVLSVDDNGSTLSIDDGAGSLTVDNAALSVTGGGTESGAQRVTIATDSTGVLSVDDNGGNLSIDDGGNSITVDAPVGTPVNVQIGNATLSAGVVDETGASAVDALAVGGGTAHDAVDSGNPQKIGGYAKAAAPSDVADGDRVNAWFTRFGAQVVSGAKAHDGAAAVGDLGLPMLGYRNDNAALTVDANADYTFIACDANGRIGISDLGGTITTDDVKAEDAGHTTADLGSFVLSVRQSEANSLTSSAGSDGDYAAFNTDAKGLLQVVARPYVSRIRVASSGLTTAATTYTIGDTAGAIMTFAGCARVSGGTGTILSATLLDKGDVGTDYRLHIFRASVSLSADNAAWAVSDSDYESLIGIVTMPSLLDVGANRAATLANIGLAYDCAATSLFVGIETRSANAVYAAATDLHLILTVCLD
jgi:hypothetical protein